MKNHTAFIQFLYSFHTIFIQLLYNFYTTFIQLLYNFFTASHPSKGSAKHGNSMLNVTNVVQIFLFR